MTRSPTLDRDALRALAEPHSDGWNSPLLESAYPDKECGCPVEEWVHRGIHLTLHFEPDGSLEMLADAGDWDRQVPLTAKTMEAARAQALAWVEALPSENDLPALRARAGDVP